MTDEIELHYWPTPNGYKITIALEEMGLPYRVKLVNINVGEQFEPAFLEIAPNNRMPAIVDPNGPDGAPISVFESGAILLYLARKTGRFAGRSERERVAVEQWLMWQMAGIGPMAGQAHHFINYAPNFDPPQDLPYAKGRYRREMTRLYGVLDNQLKTNRYAAGDFLSIADFAIWPWARLWHKQGQTLDDKPHMKRWLDELDARPAFAKGKDVAKEMRQAKTPDRRAQEILFGIRADAD
jgi:GSH-dependent disulfide-bond oxidoreductase